MSETPRLLDPLFRGVFADLFDDNRRVQRMLDFEAALARAEARVGVIPLRALAPIEAKCRVELLDFRLLAHAAAAAGNLAIPLVQQLTALVARDDPHAASYVHWGATSQDVIDTGLILQLRDAFALIESELQRLGDAVAQLVELHRNTLMAARTLLQQALPTTFGFKACGWLDALGRHRGRLREVRRRSLVLQFGGAAGTLAALGQKGLAVADALADELKLSVPDTPWHSEHDRFAEIATVLGLLTATLGKIARDISLLMQSEVSEVQEPLGPNRGGSSTMPQKRNPVGAVVALAAANRVPGLISAMLAATILEHERGVGGWHAEWELLPEIVTLTGGSLLQMAEVISGLRIDVDAMSKNLEETRGQIMAEAVVMALAESIDRTAAQAIVREACACAAAHRINVRDALLDDARVKEVLTVTDLDHLLDPRNYLGSVNQIIDRVLTSWRSAK